VDRTFQKKKSRDMLDLATSEPATFRTKVQSGGRISIPKIERETRKIEDGNVVEVTIIKVEK
jgi:hypothetical protein